MGVDAAALVASVSSDEGPVRKDVVIGTLGASAAVAGLVLVFLGIIIATYQSFSGDTPDGVLSPYKWSAWAALAVFAIGLACVGTSIAWLAAIGGRQLYFATVSLFVAQLAATFALACGAIVRMIGKPWR